MKNKNLLLLFTIFSLSYTNINFGSSTQPSTEDSNCFLSCLKAVFCCQCCEDDCKNDSNSSPSHIRNNQSRQNPLGFDWVTFFAATQTYDDHHSNSNHHHCDTSHHHCDSSHHDCGGNDYDCGGGE